MSNTRSREERLAVANETKIKCIEHELQDERASKVLFAMLDNYVEHGTTYIGKKLKLYIRSSQPRMFVVHLHNDRSKKDTVLIRVDEESASAM